MHRFPLIPPRRGPVAALVVALAASFPALPAAQAPADTSLPARPEIRSLTSSPASPVPAAATVRFRVVAAHPKGSPLEFSWEFDDGTPRTAWSRADSVVDHVFAAGGLYSVRVRVQDTLEYESVRILRLQAAAGGPAVPPRSTPIALDAALRRLWVANPDHNSVSLLDPDALALVREVPVGRAPRSVALDGQGNAWVACQGSDQVFVLAPDGGDTLAVISLDYGAGPAGLVFVPGGATAYLSLEGAGRLLRLDAASRTVTGRLDLGPSPRALALSGDGRRLLAARFISDLSAGTVWSVALPEFTSARAISLPVDSTTIESGTAARGLPNYVASLALHPDGATAWFVAKKDNIVRGTFRSGEPLTFETSLRTLIGSLDPSAGTDRTSMRLDLDNSSQPSALAFAPYGNVLFLTLQGNDRIVALDAKTRLVLAKGETGAAPQGIAVDPERGRLFVQDFLGRTVGVYEAADILRNGADTLVRVAAVPVSAREPLPEAVLAGKRIFYGAGDPRMSTDGYTSCAACHLDGAQDGQVWDFTDRGEGLRNTTTLLGKSGMGHGPLHWSANFDEMQDFEHDMRGPFGGKGFMAEAALRQGTRSTPLGDTKAGLSPELDALAAYVASLTAVRRSPYRTPDGSLTAEARAGEAIFRRADLGCAACHVPPSYTDSRLPGPTRPAPGSVTVFAGASSRYTAEGFLLHDVGTLKASSGRRLNQEPLPGLDTPTLLGLWETAPYLHDGSAATLLDVLTTANPEDEHGRASRLTAEERSQLVAFLLQLDASNAGPAAVLPGVRAPVAGVLSAVRSAGGRLQGLRLVGWLGAAPPSLGLHDLQGRRLGAFPAEAWRKPGGAPRKGEWYLPWSALRGSSTGGRPGIFLVQPLERKDLRPLKILVEG